MQDGFLGRILISPEDYPGASIELIEEFLTPSPTCEVVGLGSPLAVVVAV